MAYALLALVLVGVWLFCLFDVLTTDEGEFRFLPKFGWFLLVLLFPLAGGVLWLAAGRPRRSPEAVRRGPLSETPTGPPPGAPKGPDDDPDFLRDLDRRIKGED